MAEIIKGKFETKVTAVDLLIAADIHPDKFTEVEWNGLKIRVRDSISLEEYSEFINYVVGCNFAGANGEYTPEMSSLAFGRAILLFYTNVELPADLDKQYSLIMGGKTYCENLVFTIEEHISDAQLHDLRKAIDKNVDYLLRTKLSVINSRLEKAVDGIEQIANLISEAFGGVDEDTVQKLVSALGNSVFDEEKLVKAFVNSKFNGTEDADTEVIEKD